MNANTKPPKTITTRPKGMSPSAPSAPTKSTRFASTYRNPTNRTVYVYHSTGFYRGSAYWGLHASDFLFDPYFPGGCNLFGQCFSANYLNPGSMWFGHPVFLASRCRAEDQAPAQEQPEPAPVNVNITNEGNIVKPEDVTTTTAPAPTTTTVAP